MSVNFLHYSAVKKERSEMGFDFEPNIGYGKTGRVRITDFCRSKLLHHQLLRLLAQGKTLSHGVALVMVIDDCIVTSLQ